MRSIVECGVDSRYWYPVGRTGTIRAGKPHGFVFQGSQFVVFRSDDGHLNCLVDACAHRKVALSSGTVEHGCIVCPYHGWKYDANGVLVDVPHHPAEQIPSLRLARYPVVESDGLIWVVPSTATPLRPEPPKFWSQRPSFVSTVLDTTFENNYAVGLINGMDYFHFHLHRRYQPWSDISLQDVETTSESVVGIYLVQSGYSRPERVLRHILRQQGEHDLVSNTLTVRYDYPHHTASLGDGLVVSVAFRPETERRVAVFITMNVAAPAYALRLRRLVEPTWRRLVLAPIQRQDRWIGLLEQKAWDTYPTAGRVELNPVAAAAERLLRRRWDEYERAHLSGRGNSSDWGPERSETLGV